MTDPTARSRGARRRGPRLHARDITAGYDGRIVLTDLDVGDPARLVHGDHRPQRLRQVHAAAHAVAAAHAAGGDGRARRQGHPLLPGQGGRPPGRAAAADLDRAGRDHGGRPGLPRPLPAPDDAPPVVGRGRARRAHGAEADPDARTWPGGRSTSCPAASASGCGSRWCSPRRPRSCCSTSPPPTWTSPTSSSCSSCAPELNREGRTLVAILHDLNQAARYATHLIAMHQGEIVAEGAPATVVTAELVEQVFGVRSRIVPDPETGSPMIVPLAEGALATGSDGRASRLTLRAPDRARPPHDRPHHRHPQMRTEEGTTPMRTTTLRLAAALAAGLLLADRLLQLRRADEAAAGAPLGTVETMFGTVTVPQPEDGELTVVALGWSDAEMALALGVKPVGGLRLAGLRRGEQGRRPLGDRRCSATSRPRSSPTTRRAAELRADPGPEPRPDPERPARPRPGRLRPAVARSRPTVYAPTGTPDFATAWDVQMRSIAAALGKVAEGDAIDQVDVAGQIAAAATANPEFKGHTIASGTKFGEAYGAYLAGDVAVRPAGRRWASCRTRRSWSCPPRASSPTSRRRTSAPWTPTSRSSCRSGSPSRRPRATSCSSRWTSVKDDRAIFIDPATEFAGRLGRGQRAEHPDGRRRDRAAAEGGRGQPLSPCSPEALPRASVSRAGPLPSPRTGSEPPAHLGRDLVEHAAGVAGQVGVAVAVAVQLGQGLQQHPAPGPRPGRVVGAGLLAQDRSRPRRQEVPAGAQVAGRDRRSPMALKSMTPCSRPLRSSRLAGARSPWIQVRLRAGRRLHGELPGAPDRRGVGEVVEPVQERADPGVLLVQGCRPDGGGRAGGVDLAQRADDLGQVAGQAGRVGQPADDRVGSLDPAGDGPRPRVAEGGLARPRPAPACGPAGAARSAAATRAPRTRVRTAHGTRGSRTARSSPRRNIQWSVPLEATGRTGSRAHCGNWSATSADTRGMSHVGPSHPPILGLPVAGSTRTASVCAHGHGRCPGVAATEPVSERPADRPLARPAPT